MPSKKRRLPVYLTQEEYEQIASSAARAGISLSKFAKLVCTGIPVPSLEHKQAVQDIIKARADLGRLGGLLKQAIAADGDKFALQRLLREVDMGMARLPEAGSRERQRGCLGRAPFPQGNGGTGTGPRAKAPGKKLDGARQ